MAGDGYNGAMSNRELVVLGTASQAPTRYRNHNGYLLRWDGTDLLFDPGEGTQRQMLWAGVTASRIRAICITHFHGDHCLGLPGVLQRMALDGVAHPVAVLFPASGQVYFDRLRSASVFRDDGLDIRPVAVSGDGPVLTLEPSLTITARRLDHEPDTFGWRVEEAPGRHLLRARLDELGIGGPAVGQLLGAGALEIDGRTVTIDDVSVRRRGQAMAFVMDTGVCAAAAELAVGADLAVCEATFAATEEHLARRWRHLTAADAANVAVEAGVRLLVLAHFSQRYPDVTPLVEEAAARFPSVVAASDLDRIAVPRRPRPETTAAGLAQVIP
ncbi:MAG TPA: ribonuclease Z [Acidimicrobiales bacterium]|nr:ribonuclease Z [Acidimicrobiales bacterium]